ncbi:MAG: hypothetical protein EZS26_002378 [Candidatus Ordinivivax streblomastigis]|uniref:Uncharacterized protein n=1 Tax=Candidatus Ordinivivax streblomastigis TaxID=2540710 RepID=A0A5M8NZC4_9BACT|nr:MAG: hypothetical protein EZS26_002378 [Candidatus Ordinivivax streblomastigis]
MIFPQLTHAIQIDDLQRIIEFFQKLTILRFQILEWFSLFLLVP